LSNLNALYVSAGSPAEKRYQHQAKARRGARDVFRCGSL